MKFLPYENLTFKTRLKEQEVLDRLNKIIEPRKMFRLRLPFLKTGEHQPYEGKINGNTFEINRIIKYKNSFLPMIKGQVENSFDGTTIHVKMQPKNFVLAFMVLWLVGVGLANVLIIGNALSHLERDFNPAIFIPIIMFAFGAVLFVGAFKYESNKSIKDFQRIFEAEITNPL